MVSPCECQYDCQRGHSAVTLLALFAVGADGLAVECEVGKFGVVVKEVNFCKQIQLLFILRESLSNYKRK